MRLAVVQVCVILPSDKEEQVHCLFSIGYTLHSYIDKNAGRDDG